MYWKSNICYTDHIKILQHLILASNWQVAHWFVTHDIHDTICTHYIKNVFPSYCTCKMSQIVKIFSKRDGHFMSPLISPITSKMWQSHQMGSPMTFVPTLVILPQDKLCCFNYKVKTLPKSRGCNRLFNERYFIKCLTLK